MVPEMHLPRPALENFLHQVPRSLGVLQRTMPSCRDAVQNWRPSYIGLHTGPSVCKSMTSQHNIRSAELSAPHAAALGETAAGDPGSYKGHSICTACKLLKTHGAARAATPHELKIVHSNPTSTFVVKQHVDHNE